MKRLSLLKRKTEHFFDLHWRGTIAENPPVWLRWDLEDDFPAAPTAGGCYAVFVHEELHYIGLALTIGVRASGGEPVVGIYHRLRRHVIRPNTRGSKHYVGLVRKSDPPGWPLVSQIAVLAFPTPYRYLAASLEAYLIRELRPPRNGRKITITANETAVLRRRA